jgi:hypothetical protein
VGHDRFLHTIHNRATFSAVAAVESTVEPGYNDIGLCDTSPIASGVLFYGTNYPRRFLRFQMEEQPPIWRVAANMLNKQVRTADNGWSSSLGVGRGTNNSSP